MTDPGQTPSDDITRLDALPKGAIVCLCVLVVLGLFGAWHFELSGQAGPAGPALILGGVFVGFVALALYLLLRLGHQITVASDARKKALEMTGTIETLAAQDSLTGCLNRRVFLETAELELQRYQRTSRTFALMLIDIDQLKEINERHGEGVGNAILKTFADTVRQQFRPMDMVGRYSGEEFIILLPDTGFEGAMEAARRLLAKIDASPVQADQAEVRFTASIGVTVIEQAHQELYMLISAAQGALEDAQASGQNQVCYRLVENLSRNYGVDSIG